MGPAFADAIEQVYSEQQSQSVMASVAHVEGLLIEAARLTYGTRPKWNRVGGRRRGAARAQAAGDDLLRLMSNDPRSLFVARRSLRELSANPTWVIYETALHAARSHALMASAFSAKSSVGNGEIVGAIHLLNRAMKSLSAHGGDYQTDYDRILSDGYV
ncbi:hypothetical protein [Quadrisphaera sp. INWT6]|uniref:hypothetical protein n=1 Tax=Quadrisphaera sp. INWT6 TaxID=2596917 RepID=UPI0018925E38|nr:hypothetical protein [Quadrisphaera sp. INWT6]